MERFKLNYKMLDKPKNPCLIGDPFELRLDADAHENTPLGMVQVAGKNPEDWSFTGKCLTGKLIGRFQLVDLSQGIHHSGYMDSDAKSLILHYGYTMPSGQWIKALLNTFPKGGVAIADDSWHCDSQDNHNYFPSLRYFQNEITLAFCPSSERTGMRWLVNAPGIIGQDDTNSTVKFPETNEIFDLELNDG